MNQPRVTILMPLYNAERFVAQALRSLLQDQAVPLEVIVIDHQSSDRSVALVQAVGDPRLRLVTHQGGGIAEVLNTGLGLARAEFMARCDADDLYPPDRLATQIAWLEQHPEFAAVAGNYAAIDQQGRPLIRFQCGDQETDITEELRTGLTRTHLGTFLLRTAVVHQLGGFRSYFTTAEDIDLQLRLGDRYRVGYCPQVVYHYRIHPTSITHTRASNQRDFFDQVARRFQQQRQTQGEDDLQRGSPPPVPSPLTPPYSAPHHSQDFLIGRAWQEVVQGRRHQALGTSLRAWWVYPQNLRVWPAIARLWLKLAWPWG